MFFDTHAHLDLSPLCEAEEAVVRRSREAGVSRIATVGIDPESAERAVAIAHRHTGVYAVIGLHPHDSAQDRQPLRDLVAARPVGLVGVGETGLDYYYEHAPRATQRRAFAEQVGWAHEFDLALVIHAREAVDDIVDILASEGTPSRTVIHCFTGTAEEAERYLAAGCDISVAGIVTFKNAESLREAVRLVPADRLHVETDSPFLAPVPFRGQANEPANVAVVGAFVAQLRGEDVDLLATTTAANTSRLFALER